MLGVFRSNTTPRQPLARSRVRLSVMADACSASKSVRGACELRQEDGGKSCASEWMSFGGPVTRVILSSLTLMGAPSDRRAISVRANAPLGKLASPTQSGVWGCCWGVFQVAHAWKATGMAYLRGLVTSVKRVQDAESRVEHGLTHASNPPPPFFPSLCHIFCKYNFTSQIPLQLGFSQRNIISLV